MFDISTLKFDANGLIPAVVVDSATKKVLTVAYMNKESLAISMEKGLTCFWSRSRQELWLKGDTTRQLPAHRLHHRRLRPGRSGGGSAEGRPRLPSGHRQLL